MSLTPTRARAATTEDRDAALPTPRAGRLQRPSWRDGRLIAGILLVLLAMITGALTLQHFNHSVTVLQASHTLEPGDQLGTGDVTAVDVRLDSPQTYLSAIPTDGAGRVVREVREGELIPRTAIGDAAALQVRAIAVPVTGASAATLQRGSSVDVWVSERQSDATGTTSYKAPQRLLERVSVASVPSSGDGLSGATGDPAVQVMVPQDQVAALLAAMNSGGKVDLVPVSAGSAP
ncbi:hypothetical protein ATK17_2140 [Branchiibius hedensis]|uniref:SAF domain-containing protein n=1 Tax=Branchiibius hedensis TaxID=672460 RepID=A0A2Y8ZQZ7_9MICO|nr:hypothetical protein [Branchiibius hedensis]PWJ25998.1 hypothetical protein ATK17_2140 [Branchiibius hedensis]SSA34810.1 hypothetical protein SAMN04489750_2140 [Branchiibius hedensis]